MSMDASTLIGKSLLGMQAWHNTPNDGSGQGWGHWFRPGLPATAENAAFDVYPDVSEFPDDELEATEMLLPNGKPARLFSSYRYATMLRYFEQMRSYGIDGASLGRFISGTSDGVTRARLDTILGNMFRAAAATDRVAFVWYDSTGVGPSNGLIQADLEHLTAQGVFASPNYLHHRGKPLIGIYGPGDTALDGDQSEWQQVVTFAKSRWTLLLGGPRLWRADPVLLQADVIAPWAVMAFRDLAGVEAYRRLYLEPDLAFATAHGIDFLPIVWPGFSSANLGQNPADLNIVPRLGGEFYWKQVHAAVSAGVRCLFTAMWDDDEGTAIWKSAATQAEVPQ